MIKTVLCVAIFAACVGIGIYIWNKYKLRKVFFENLVNFCEALLVEISFSKNTVRDIIKIYAAGYCRPFRMYLAAYQALVDAKSDITRDKLGTVITDTFLKSHERNILVDFFYELGRHGIDGETAKIQSKKSAFQTFFDAATSALRNDASIYLKCFIIMGIAGVVIII